MIRIIYIWYQVLKGNRSNTVSRLLLVLATVQALTSQVFKLVNLLAGYTNIWRLDASLTVAKLNTLVTVEMKPPVVETLKLIENVIGVVKFNQ